MILEFIARIDRRVDAGILFSGQLDQGKRSAWFDCPARALQQAVERIATGLALANPEISRTAAG